MNVFVMDLSTQLKLIFNWRFGTNLVQTL